MRKRAGRGVALGQQVFDDGSTVTTDDSGNVIAVTNSVGDAQYVPPSGGSAIVQQFSALFNRGIQAVADTVSVKLASAGGKPAAAPGTPQSGAKSNYTPLLLLGAGFLLLRSLRAR